MKEGDLCPFCEKHLLKLGDKKTIKGSFGSALEGVTAVPYTFTTRWLECEQCEEKFLTAEEDKRWDEMCEKLREEFKKLNKFE